MNPELRNKLSWWHLKAKKEKDLWVRFVLYYLIFDAFISDGSGSGNDQEKLRWFVNSENSLKASIDGGWQTRLLPLAKILKGMSPVQDMRPGSTRDVSVIDENNLEEVFAVIYQIRCNLFHGSKDVMNGRDSNLVEHAGNFLRYMIDWWFVST